MAHLSSVTVRRFRSAAADLLHDNDQEQNNEHDADKHGSGDEYFGCKIGFLLETSAFIEF
jgi:hypothetical protein